MGIRHYDANANELHSIPAMPRPSDHRLAIPRKRNALTPMAGTCHAPRPMAAPTREPAAGANGSASPAGGPNDATGWPCPSTTRALLAGETAGATSHNLISLAALEPGRRAVIRAVGRTADGAADAVIERRLLEIGFEEGREAEIRHVSPIGNDPIAVHVDELNIAIRRSEAAFVLVEVLAPPPADGGSGASDAVAGPAR